MMLLSLMILGAANVVHPVFPPQYAQKDVESLKKNVSDAMAMSLQELYESVPDCSGIFFCGCPHCDGGAQEHALQWHLELGDRVKCRHCGMEFPNDQYPENREKTITAPSGAIQVYRWHEAKSGRQYFYQARAWYAQWEWARDRALRLANLSALTGEAGFADRAALIVGRFAQVYPDYAIRFDYPFHPVRFWAADRKFPYDEDIPPFRGAKFYWWGFGDIPKKLARAYDLVVDSGCFERQRDLLGADIEGRIERDLIRMGYEFAAANPDEYGNMSPGLYADMIVAGRVIGAPEMVHEAVNRFNTLLQRQFFFDGWWRECAPSYHWQTIGNLSQVVGVARGYTDPQDWPEPRLVNLDLEAQTPFLAKTYAVGYAGCLPDGRKVPMNDTWWSGRSKTLDESLCHMWTGMGHAVLGAGKKDTQFQAHINWNPAYGHTHMDSGAIILYAHGKELLSDIGYTHTRYRNWTINSASHNMVVVDQRSQQLTSDPRMTGDVLFFDDQDPHVNVIDLDVQPAYPECEVYRRRLVHVHVSEGQDYLVDCFDVVGGTTHDFFLHGSADEEGAFESSVPLTQPIESLVPDWGGTEEHTGENCHDVAGEKHHHYMFLWNVLAAGAEGPCILNWRYGDVGLDTFLFPEEGATLHRFQAPSVRLARSDDTKLKDHLMNGVMVRHTGGKSRFQAVHVPFKGTAWVKNVVWDGDRATVALNDETHEISFDGDALRVVSSAGWSYERGTPVSGTLASVGREGGFWFEATEAVPDARWVRIDFGGTRGMFYRVASVEGTRFLLEDDPGFAYQAGKGDAAFLYHPHDSLPGPITWTVWP
ncbi:MAG: hypothetical protein GY851_19725 [bacterium]|nr:hypothetical protein [bacterium]